MMRVGVKYCGGCNPRYNRSDFIRRLGLRLDSAFRIEHAVPEDVYEMLLLVGGCSSCCAEYAQYQVTERVIRITGDQDFDRAVILLAPQ